MDVPLLDPDQGLGLALGFGLGGAGRRRQVGDGQFALETVALHLCGIVEALFRVAPACEQQPPLALRGVPVDVSDESDAPVARPDLGYLGMRLHEV